MFSKKLSSRVSILKKSPLALDDDVGEEQEDEEEWSLCEHTNEESSESL